MFYWYKKSVESRVFKYTFLKFMAKVKVNQFIYTSNQIYKTVIFFSYYKFIKVSTYQVKNIV